MIEELANLIEVPWPSKSNPVFPTHPESRCEKYYPAVRFIRNTRAYNPFINLQKIGFKEEVVV